MANSDKDLALESVKTSNKRFGFIRPRLNYRAGPLCSMPPTIDPRNWTKITPDELKAHEERQMIRGRLRREFWTKAYHPENGKYFNPNISDEAFVRFGRLKTVWHIKDTVKASGKFPLQSLFYCVGVPLMLLGCFIKFEKRKHDSIFDLGLVSGK